LLACVPALWPLSNAEVEVTDTNGNPVAG